MDLNKWQPKHFESSLWVKLKASLGAGRWRCEYCRINFASFRWRKEVFTFKRWSNRSSDSAVADGRARIAELEAKVNEQRERDEALHLATVKAEFEEQALLEQQEAAERHLSENPEALHD